jgi:hypothetical protein
MHSLSQLHVAADKVTSLLILSVCVILLHPSIVNAVDLLQS